LTLLLQRKTSFIYEEDYSNLNSRQLNGFWVDPFGISPNVKIGPTMALELGITYAVSIF